MKIRFFGAVLILSFLGACGGGTIKRDGFTLEKQYTDEAIEVISRRAAFDMSCTEGGLSYVIISVYDDMGADAPKQVGVVGCGKKLIYTNVNVDEQVWVMDSSAGQAQAAQPEKKMVPNNRLE